MATLQRLTFDTDSSIDLLQLRSVHYILRSLCLPRPRLLLEILSDHGALNVSEIERHMYHAGDKYISQSYVSNTIYILLRAKVIRRVYLKKPDDHRNHYYTIVGARIAHINRVTALLANH